MLGAAAALPQTPARAVVTMTAADVNELRTAHRHDEILRDAVHRLFSRVTCTTGGVVPVGSRQWWDAPAIVQVASVALVGQRYLPDTPPKQAAAAVSAAVNWRAEASVPSHAELQRRRYPPTGDRDLWIRYGPTGPPPEGAAA